MQRLGRAQAQFRAKPSRARTPRSQGGTAQAHFPRHSRRPPLAEGPRGSKRSQGGEQGGRGRGAAAAQGLEGRVGKQSSRSLTTRPPGRKGMANGQAPPRRFKPPGSGNNSSPEQFVGIDAPRQETAGWRWRARATPRAGRQTMRELRHPTHQPQGQAERPTSRAMATVMPRPARGGAQQSGSSDGVIACPPRTGPPAPSRRHGSGRAGTSNSAEGEGRKQGNSGAGRTQLHAVVVMVTDPRGGRGPGSGSGRRASQQVGVQFAGGRVESTSFPALRASTRSKITGESGRAG